MKLFHNIPFFVIASLITAKVLSNFSRRICIVWNGRWIRQHLKSHANQAQSFLFGNLFNGRRLEFAWYASHYVPSLSFSWPVHLWLFKSNIYILVRHNWKKKCFLSGIARKGGGGYLCRIFWPFSYRVKAPKISKYLVKNPIICIFSLSFVPS